MENIELYLDSEWHFINLKSIRVSTDLEKEHIDITAFEVDGFRKPIVGEYFIANSGRVKWLKGLKDNTVICRHEYVGSVDARIVLRKKP